MPGELEIIVKTTDGCNARCLYCSAGSDPTGERRLSLDHARALCDQAGHLLDDGVFDRVRFLWHGGEPLLLGKNFFRALHDVGRPGRIRHNIQTNLTLLDAEWIDVLEPLIGKRGLGSSVDPFHDVRRLGNHDGYVKRWLDRLALLDDAGWRIGCVFVLHRQALSRAADIYWFFRNLRDNASLSLRVNPLLRVGRAQDASCDDLLLEPGDHGAFLVELTKVWLADHRRLVLSPVRDMVRAWEGEGRVRACDLAGRAGCMDAHLGVDPDGFLYNCGRAVDADGMKFGHLREISFADCLDHPSRRRLQDREAALVAGPCGTCPDWRMCHGGCPYESHAASETAHEPTLLCNDYRHYFRWLEQALGPRREPDAVSVDRVKRDDSADAASATGPSPTHPLLVRVGPKAGIAAVKAQAAAGRAVLLSEPRDWSPADLSELADFYLHAPDLNVPIEPFHSLVAHVSPHGRGRSLPSWYNRPPASRDPLSPCGTCEAYKHCRGFWLDDDSDAELCAAWKAIHRSFMQAQRQRRWTG